MKIVEKTLAFLNKSKKAQAKKLDKLTRIIEHLEKTKQRIREEYRNEHNKKRKEKLLKELKVLGRLLKKSKKRLVLITKGKNGV